jgi:mRNA interferase MazF
MAPGHPDPGIQQGDIYWFQPLDASGSEQAGMRPYIIMSRSAVNRNRPTVVGVPLSTNLTKANQYFRIIVPVAEIVKDINCTSQLNDSVALCDHVRVLDVHRLRQKIGRLSGTAVAGVGLGLAFVFDLR